MGIDDHRFNPMDPAMTLQPELDSLRTLCQNQKEQIDTLKQRVQWLESMLNAKESVDKQESLHPN